MRIITFNSFILFSKMNTLDTNIVTDVTDKNENTKPIADGFTMKKTVELPEDFDYQPASIAKIAMMENDSHPDLIGMCRNILVSAHLTEEQLSIFDSHFLLQQAKGKSLLAQRAALNAFWHLQFSTLSTDGYGARQLLVMVGDDLEWIKWFSTQPLDLIISKSLPK